MSPGARRRRRRHRRERRLRELVDALSTLTRVQLEHLDILRREVRIERAIARVQHEVGIDVAAGLVCYLVDLVHEYDGAREELACTRWTLERQLGLDP